MVRVTAATGTPAPPLPLPPPPPSNMEITSASRVDCSADSGCGGPEEEALSGSVVMPPPTRADVGGELTKEDEEELGRLLHPLPPSSAVVNAEVSPDAMLRGEEEEEEAAADETGEKTAATLLPHQPLWERRGVSVGEGCQGSDPPPPCADCCCCC